VGGVKVLLTGLHFVLSLAFFSNLLDGLRKGFYCFPKVWTGLFSIRQDLASVAFIGAVPKLRKVIISFVICLSVCPHGTTRLPLVGY